MRSRALLMAVAPARPDAALGACLPGVDLLRRLANHPRAARVETVGEQGAGSVAAQLSGTVP